MIEPIYRRPRRFNEKFSCAGKGRFRNERAARYALAAMKADGLGRWDSSVRPYRCTAGRRPHWHLGHET